jgi:hypothetical protein
MISASQKCVKGLLSLGMEPQNSPLEGTAPAVDQKEPTAIARVRKTFADSLATSRASCLTAVAVCAFGFWLPYSFRAGFLYDDWAIVAGREFHTSLGHSYRPGIELFDDLVFPLFKTSPLGYYLVLTILMAAMAVMTVLALNGLGLPLVPSTAVGILIVVSPYADSMGLWWAASQMSLAMTFGLAAVVAAARWINRCRHEWWYFGTSLALLIAAVSTYEAVTPIVLLPLAMIGLSTNRRRVLAWTLPGSLTAGISALILFERALSSKSRRPAAQYPARIERLFRTGTSTFLHHVVGFITIPDLLIAVAVALATMYAGMKLVKLGEKAKKLEWRWLALSLALLIMATYLAWTPIVPAVDYYFPGVLGVGNRINLLAQMYFVTSVVVTLVSAAKIAGKKTVPALVGVAITSGLFAGLFSTYFSQTHEDQQSYVYAQSLRLPLIANIKRLLPRVAPHTDIVLADYYPYASPQWVPILAAPWDATGAFDLLYDNKTILGQPFSSSMRCTNSELIQQPIEHIRAVPFRRVVFVEISLNRTFRIDNASQCRAALSKLTVNANPILEP